MKILETFVDALLTAKTKKTKPDENLIIKIVKEDKPFDNSGMDAIKILKEGLKNRPEREQVTYEKANKKDIKSVIEQAKNDFFNLEANKDTPHDQDKPEEAWLDSKLFY